MTNVRDSIGICGASLAGHPPVAPPRRGTHSAAGNSHSGFGASGLSGDISSFSFPLLSLSFSFFFPRRPAACCCREVHIPQEEVGTLRKFRFYGLGFRSGLTGAVGVTVGGRLPCTLKNYCIYLQACLPQLLSATAASFWQKCCAASVHEA